MPLDFARFGADDLRQCSDALIAATASATTMETAAREACAVLRRELVDASGEPVCAMVRCYKTHRFSALPDDLRAIARRAFGAIAISPPDPAMKVLTLMATVGDEPPWNDRHASRGHQAIPLPSRHIVERAPMIAQLIRELGFDIAKLLRPSADIVHDMAGTSYGVFHVENAEGSPYIPAQDGFVKPYAIRSVLGFGGALPDGEIAALIVFSRAHIPSAAAHRFRPMAFALTTCLASRDAAVFDGAA